MNNTRILYDFITPGEPALCQTEQGETVWPIRNTDELAALETITRTFNCQLEKVASQPAAVLTEANEVVAALGGHCLDAAQLYAHLTGRCVRSVETLEELAALSPSLAVVVTTAEWLDDPLLRTLYDSYEGPAVGIVCARDLAQLQRQVLIRSAAASLAGPIALPRLDVWPLLNFDTASEGGYELVGIQAGKEAIKHALGRGAGVLTLITHSDGVDTLLTPELTLCSMDNPPGDGEMRRAPRCQITGYCHRQNMSVQEALSAGRLIAPEALAARVFVYEVCYGVLLPRSAVDAAWGTIWRMLDNPALGAIITTWEIIVTGLTEIDELSRAIAEGEPVGTALGDFTRSRHVLRRACLLGDPRVHLPLHSRTLPFLEEPYSSEHERAQREQDLNSLAFLHACVLAAAPTFSGDLAERASRALEAIDNYTVNAWRGNPLEGEADSPGAVLRAAIMHYMFRRGKLVDDWYIMAEQSQYTDPRICWSCDTPTNSRIATFRIPGVPRRRLSICPRCGFIEDVPMEIDLRLRIEGNTIYLVGEIPQEKNWIGGVTLWSGKTVESVSYPWPTSATGMPADHFAVPTPWPQGPLRTAVTFIWRTTIVLLSRQARAELIQ